jgi:hypothetical protein
MLYRGHYVSCNLCLLALYDTRISPMFGFKIEVFIHGKVLYQSSSEVNKSGLMNFTA